MSTYSVGDAMATRINGRGTLLVEWQRKGVGKLRKASGTNNVKTHGKIVQMLTSLYEEPRWDVLEAIRDGLVTPLEVYFSWSKGELDALPIGLANQKLTTLWEEYMAGKSLRPATVKSYRSTVDTFTRSFGDVRVSQLPEQLGAYYTTAKAAGTAKQFNYTRTVLLGMLNKMLGADHQITKDVKHINPLQQESTSATAFSVKEAGAFFTKLDPKSKAIARSMLFTGMSQSEYWGEWDLQEDRVLIHGKKRAGRYRVVPLLQTDIVPPTLTYSTFTKRLRAASEGVTPHSFRRTLTNWLLSAGIPKSRVDSYMGWGASNMTDRYARQDVEAYLADDIETFEAWLTAELTKEVKPIKIPSHDMFKMLYFGR